MPLILTPRHGFVAVLDDPVEPAELCPSYHTTLPDWDGPNVLKCFVTRTQLNFPEGFQFQHSMDELIYAYVFGSRIGEVTVSGIAFALLCQTGGSGCSDADPDKVHGIERIFDYYQKHKISKQADPVKLTIGFAKCFNGFLTAFAAGVLDPKIDLYEFSLRLHCDPKDFACDWGE
jgi:hypothetical protein